MTKDEASDLRSLIERAEECGLDLQRAQLAKVQADSNLASMLHRLQYPQQKA